MPTIPLQHRRPDPNAPTKLHRALSALSSPSSFLSDTAARIRLRSPAPVQAPSAHLDTRDSLDAAYTADSSLLPRTTLPPIPDSYQGINAGPAAGTIVGIVLGAVLGFLLLFWLIVAVVGNRANAQYVEGDDTEIVVRRDHHSSRRSRHTRTRHTRSETSESSSRPPPRQHSSRGGTRTERILVTETRRTESRAPPRPASPSIVQERESIHIREQSRNSRRVEGDDMVEVTEEISDASPDQPRRKKGSGYRTVDPTKYGGGNYPQREVYGGDRDRSRRNR